MGRDITQTNLQLTPYQIIIRPLVTEKSLKAAELFNQYAFEVHPLANKRMIRDAVEELFNVKVLRVNTQNRRGKPRRFRFKRGSTKSWKKAIVTLHPEYRIDFF
jgi:large subunit ribosomal protein L23